ncbi:hypothetical protein D3C84_628820 [compost metagenome]
MASAPRVVAWVSCCRASVSCWIERESPICSWVNWAMPAFSSSISKTARVIASRVRVAWSELSMLALAFAPFSVIACRTPLALFCRRWMMAWISAVDAAVFCARLRTSSATTAKPRPCSPARAASMAALSARRLVCSAMLRITVSTEPTCWVSSSSFCIACTEPSTLLPRSPMLEDRLSMFRRASSAWRVAALASSEACRERCATSWMLPAMVPMSRLMESVRSCWERALSSAPWVRRCSSLDICSSGSAVSMMARMVPCSRSSRPLNRLIISPISSSDWTFTWRVRSPSPLAMALSDAMTPRTLVMTWRITSTAPRLTSSNNMRLSR